MRFFPVNNDRTEEFLALLSEHSREIYVYIFRLTLNKSDADDIFQETNLLLWRKFDSFASGTNFRAWAYRIAGNQVLAWRKRLKRDRLSFSGVFLKTIAKEMEEDDFSLDSRIQPLSECLGQLSEGHRNLIALRYEKQLDVPDIASRKKKNVDAVYRALNRIRHALFDCVMKKSKEAT